VVFKSLLRLAMLDNPRMKITRKLKKISKPAPRPATTKLSVAVPSITKAWEIKRAKPQRIFIKAVFFISYCINVSI